MKRTLILLLPFFMLIYGKSMATQNSKPKAKAKTTVSKKKKSSEEVKKAEQKPTNGPALPKQCKAKGKDGKRCTRTTLDKSGKCFMHGGA